MYKKYTIPLPSYGTWGSRKPSWDGPTSQRKKSKTHVVNGHKLYLRNQYNIDSTTWKEILGDRNALEKKIGRWLSWHSDGFQNQWLILKVNNLRY